MRKIFSSQKCDSLAGSEGACAGTGWITWIFAMLSHDLRSLMERGGSPNESVPALTARRCLPPPLALAILGATMEGVPAESRKIVEIGGLHRN